MSASDPDVSRPRLILDASLLAADRKEIARRRGGGNRLGFAYQIAFVRVLGRFPRQQPLEVDGEILRFVALQLRMDPGIIQTYTDRRQTVSEHRQQIRGHLSLRSFDAEAGDRMAQFLEGEAQRLDVGEDEPFSTLSGLKANPSRPSVGGMMRLLAKLESTEATGALEIGADWINANYQRVLFRSVRNATADRLRGMNAPRRHLALACFLHQAWREALDQAVDTYGKLLNRNRKQVEHRLDELLKSQRQSVDRIVHRYRDLSAILN